MRRLIVCVAVAAGCASAPSRVRQAKKALVAIDIKAETDAAAIQAARHAAVEACRALDLPTEDARRRCLGPLAVPVGPTAAAASEAYDAAVEALESLAVALEALNKMRAAAEEATKP